MRLGASVRRTFRVCLRLLAQDGVDSPGSATQGAEHDHQQAGEEDGEGDTGDERVGPKHQHAGGAEKSQAEHGSGIVPEPPGLRLGCSTA